MLPAVTLNGKAQPVPVYRVGWVPGDIPVAFEAARVQRRELGN